MFLCILLDASSSTALCTQKTYMSVSFERCVQLVFSLYQLPGDRKKESFFSCCEGKVMMVQPSFGADTLLDGWLRHPGPTPGVSEAGGLSGAG